MSDAEVVSKIDNNIKYYNTAKLLLGVLVSIVIIALVLLQFIILFNVGKTADQIQDCLNISGSCYKNSTQRSGDAVKRISENQKRIVTVAAYCAKQPGNNTLQQIEDCTNKELNR